MTYLFILALYNLKADCQTASQTYLEPPALQFGTFKRLTSAENGTLSAHLSCNLPRGLELVGQLPRTRIAGGFATCPTHLSLQGLIMLMIRGCSISRLIFSFKYADVIIIFKRFDSSPFPLSVSRN